MLFSVMLSLTAFAGADSKEQKVVRIGYVSAENYEEGGEGEYKRGFGYEYFQKISYITGWKYEYVYGSFAECYQKLVDGEIDLFGNVSYTPERAELFFYSDYPQGKDTYWLYAANHRKDLLTNDLTNLNGIRIGVTKNSFQEGLLNEWLENNNLTAEVIGCNGFDEMMTRSDDKDLDAFVAPDLSVNYGYDIITGVGFSDYYFAVSKQRPDILGELNAALYEIQNSNSDYNSLLVSKYYYKMASGISMNVEEKEWLANNNNTIRIGALKNYLPFIGEDANGEVVGLITTVIDSLKRDYDVNIELITYPDIFSMKDDLENDRIDLVGPVVGDLYLAEQLDYVLTDSFVETTPVIIFKGDNYLESLKSIATTEESIFTRSVIEVMFPDAEIIECKSGEDGLRAVATGKAGCMIIPSARINIVRSYPDMKGLSVAEMTNRTDINFFTTKEKRRAASIVNKAILHTSVSLIGIVLAEYSGIENKMSAAEFIRQNAGYVVVILIIIISSLSFLIIKLIKSRKQLDKALTEATELNATVEESNKKLTDQLEIIDSVAQVFVCLYYIDLEKQTYVKVGPTAEFVEKVIGHCGNIKEGFEKMYKYLVDDSYDVTMREFTDLSTLDERLKNHKWISCQFLGRTGWA
ncbi:MAG: transporter substrate-binding domain-containing protein, partial [Eubacteriales bacterium]|nr:transporter substrate-binding domain-containing protein [Eubacteriales bacterium]